MIKNNNPGNIRYSESNNWQGQVGQDSRGFCIFDSMYNGTRAMIKLILYYIEEGYDTIPEIVYKYAPPSENNSSAYVQNVSQWSGISTNTVLSITNQDQILRLIGAMVFMETSEDINYTTALTAYNALINDSPVIDPVESQSSSFAFLPLIIIGGFIYSQSNSNSHGKN